VNVWAVVGLALVTVLFSAGRTLGGPPRLLNSPTSQPGSGEPSRTASSALPHVHRPSDFDLADSVDALKIEWDSLKPFYQRYEAALDRKAGASPYGLALADLTVGLLTSDSADIAKAESLFAADAESASNPREREIDRLAHTYAAEILSGEYPPVEGGDNTVTPIKLDRMPAPTGDFHTLIIGRSAIRLKHNAIVKTQVDRVSRDWQLGWNVTSPPWLVAPDRITTWHEGLRVRELIQLIDARVSCVWGTKVRKIGEKWYGPDADGKPRFELATDKVCNYPTTIYLDDRTAILNDSHGISSIAWDCLGADLALGCGDHPGKMDAAVYLARRGVNVYVPTDRFIGLLVGVRTKAPIIGSAPIKKSGDGAVIGDQPISIDVNEPIVVSDSKAGYPLRYYDSPRRYFDALSDWCGKPLRITAVEVTQYGHAEVVVDQARKIGAKVLGIRVKSRAEHDAVAAWLTEDRARRAVLFHSAAYPDGYRLFSEFPAQTSFGDIVPAVE
jgi:hypothetical protein